MYTTHFCSCNTARVIRAESYTDSTQEVPLWPCVSALLHLRGGNLVWPRPEDMSTILHTPLDTNLRPVTIVTMEGLTVSPTYYGSHDALGHTADLGKRKVGAVVQGHMKALYTVCFFFLLGIY